MRARLWHLACCLAVPAAGQPITLRLHPLATADAAAAVGVTTVHWAGQLWSAVEVEAAQTSRLLAEESAEEERPAPGDAEFYFSLGMSILMVLLAGLMAGCTMGLLSLDVLTLRLKTLEGTPSEQEHANAILPVLANHHRLLVSLLLCNAAANEALPIFLDAIVDARTAVLISVTCVLLFGEILPSAVMTGKYQLPIGAALAPVVVRGLMLVTAPISWPLAKLLDVVLGHQQGMTRYKRNEFKALIRLQTARNVHERASRPASVFASVVESASAAAARDAAAAARRKASLGGRAFSASEPTLPVPGPLRRANSGTKAANALRENFAVAVAASPRCSDAGGAQAAHARRSSRDGAVRTAGSPRASAAGAGAGGQGSDKASDPLPIPTTSLVLGADEFSDDEVTILHGVLDLQTKMCANLLDQPRNTFDRLHMVSYDEKMDVDLMQLLIGWGHSRVPVYRGRRNNVVGLLLIKEHLMLDPADETPIAQLTLRKPALALPSASIFEVLNTFQTGKSHMALVSDHAVEIEEAWRDGRDVPEHVVILGVCTIEDVVEEIIGEEIIDETDYDEGTPSDAPPSGRLSSAPPASELERAAPYGPSDPLLPPPARNPARPERME